MRPERVLVTGASRGIGRAVAESLLRQGRSVVLLARDEASLRVVKTLADAPGWGDAAVLAVDLSVEVCDVVARALVPFAGLDGLVHAAGVADHAPLEAITETQLSRAFELHVRAPLHLSRDLAAHLRATGRAGSMVHIASTLALRPAPGTLVYSATKAALVAMTKVLAAELAPDRIRVNAVAPGGVDTAMVADRREALAALHPLGRLGTPPEVADAVGYLLDAEWATGTVLTLDGGLTAA